MKASDKATNRQPVRMPCTSSSGVCAARGTGATLRLTAASCAGSAVFAVLTFGKPFMPAIIERRREWKIAQHHALPTGCMCFAGCTPLRGVLSYACRRSNERRPAFRTENFQSFADVTNRAQCAMMLA